MEKTVNIHQAKTHLSRLVAEVEEGAEIVIARGGKPVARLLPFETPSPRRVLGADRDIVRIAADFDAPLADDLLAEFER